MKPRVRHRDGETRRRGTEEPREMALLRGQRARGEVDDGRRVRGLEPGLALPRAKDAGVGTDGCQSGEGGRCEKDQDGGAEGIEPHPSPKPRAQLAPPRPAASGARALDLASQGGPEEDQGARGQEFGLGELEHLGRAAVEHGRHQRHDSVQEELAWRHFDCLTISLRASQRPGISGSHSVSPRRRSVAATAASR